MQNFLVFITPYSIIHDSIISQYSTTYHTIKLPVQYLGHTRTKKLFIVYVKFRSHRQPAFHLAALQEHQAGGRVTELWMVASAPHPKPRLFPGHSKFSPRATPTSRLSVTLLLSSGG